MVLRRRQPPPAVILSGPAPLVPTPPTATAILEAMARLPAEAGRGTAAAVAMALPVDELPGISLRVIGGRWHYRDGQVRVAGVAQLSDLVASAHRPGDRYLDLAAGDPQDWVRLARSGVNWLPFGSSALVGHPEVLVAGRVPPRYVAAAWRAARTADPSGGLVRVGWRRFVVTGQDPALRVDLARGAPRPR